MSNHEQPVVDITTKTREKFRTSCDPCAAAKVRCSKEQPRCARCAQYGRKCVYGRSRRKGKPPGCVNRASLQASERPESTSVLPPVNSPGNYQWNLADSIFTDTSYSAPALGHLMQGTWESIVHSMAEASQYDRTNPQGFLMDTHLPSDSPPLLSSAPPPRLGTSLTEWTARMTRNTMAYSGSDVADDEPAENDEEGNAIEDNQGMEVEIYEMAHVSCIATACQTLSSLYQLTRSDGAAQNRSPRLSSQNSSSPSKQVPTSDLVFHTARGATATVSRLLSCACSSAHDPSLLSLLATIVSKILAWYQELYDHDIASIGTREPTTPTDATPTTVPSSASSSSNSKPGKSVYTVPLTIGTLHLPRETETRMKAQLLLCELRPVFDACQLLIARVNASEDTWGEKVVCNEFHANLQLKLGELKRLLTTACS